MNIYFVNEVKTEVYRGRLLFSHQKSSLMI